MSSPTGAHGEADATKQENEQQPQSTASTDATLNARAKSSNGAKSQGPKKWLIALIAVIAAVAVIVAIAVTRGKNDDANTSGVTKADTVTIGLKLAPVSLDIRHQSGSAIEQVLIGNVYEALLSRDSDNKVQPGLAKSWDISKDGKTYTFHLNQNMTFSNGDKLDADDVAWSINQLKEKQYYNANQVASLDKAEAVDANTVKLTLSTPDSNLLWYLTGRPGLVFDKNAKYNAKTEAVGSGPYTVESFDSASKMVLKANAKYWGTAHKPATQNVVIRFLTDDNAAVNALKSGDVDVLSPVNATLAKSLDASTYTVSAADGSDKFVLAFNCTNAKLKDKRVRQALNLAINRQALVKVAFAGYATPATGVVPPSIAYAQSYPAWPYDPAKARQLLKEAGYPNGFSTTLWSSHNHSTAQKVLQFTQQQLAQVGIKAQVTAMDAGQRAAEVEGKGQKESGVRMFYTGWSASTGEADWALSPLFASQNWPPTLFNTAFYSNPQVDNALSEALKTTDPQQKTKLYKEAQDIIWKESPWVPLVVEKLVSAHSKNLTGFYIQPDTGFSFEQADLTP